MRAFPHRAAAAILALVATTSVIAGIDALARRPSAVAVVTLPPVEIVATRAVVATRSAEVGPDHVVR